MNTDATGYQSPGRTCPLCNAPVFRVSRRLIDVLVSVFVPLRRFRCRSMKCGWEGNFRVKGLYSLDPGQGRHYEDNKYHLMESSRMDRGGPPAKPSK